MGWSTLGAGDASRVYTMQKLTSKNVSLALFVLILFIFALYGMYNLAVPQTALQPESLRAYAQEKTTFLETFDGKPGAPEAFSQLTQDRWDIQIHSRNQDTWEKMSAMEMHHPMNCGSPLTDSATPPFGQQELQTHHSDGAYEDAVFKCNDHVMTAVNGVGKSINDSYALAVLTPNHLVDFSEKEATIRFNVTTYRTTQRDWIDIWITPWGDNLNLPFDTSTVDLQGMPMNTVQIVMIPPNDNSKTGFKPKIMVNGKDTGEFQMYTSDFNWYTAYEDYLPGKVGNPKRRDTFEIKISKNHISICMPQDTSDDAPSQTICWANKTIQTLPFTQGVVQFAHHSYTPNKDCNLYSPLNCGPDTWHWDDIMIDPALPFTMIKADKRMVTDENSVVTFQSPAPADAKLRFSAAGSVQLSVNGSAYKPAIAQLSTQPNVTHVNNYFVTIPEGTKTVRFKLSDVGGGVHAKDFAIWSPNNAQVLASPIASPMASPTPLASVFASPSPSPEFASPSPSPLTASPTPLPSKDGSLITIHAAGTPLFRTYPTIALQINGSTVARWKNVRGDALNGVFELFTYVSKVPVSPSQVRVQFTNDGSISNVGDRNVRIDKIRIDGIDYQSESTSTYSVGSWSANDGCGGGYKASEWLHCNGYFQY